MYRFSLLTLLVSSSYCYLFAQNANLVTGARSLALAGTAVTLTDLFAANDNQAGLGKIKNTEAGIFYANHFLLPQLGLKSVVLALPAKSGTFGLSITSFGYARYCENKYGIAFGKALSEQLTLGIQVNYLYTHIDEIYADYHTITAAIGLQTQLTTDLRLGVHLYNPTHHKLKPRADERIPTIFRLGLQYNFNEKVITVIETEKDIDLKPLLKIGIEYRTLRMFYLRAGISTYPSVFCFGFGTQLSSFKLDVAAGYQNLMGFSPTITCSYQFNRLTTK